MNLTFLKPANIAHALRPDNITDFSVTHAQNFVRSNAMRNVCGLFALYAIIYAAYHVALRLWQARTDADDTRLIQAKSKSLDEIAKGLGTAMFFSFGTLSSKAGWAVAALALSNTKLWSKNSEGATAFSFTVLPYIQEIGLGLANLFDNVKPSLAFPIRNYNANRP